MRMLSRLLTLLVIVAFILPVAISHGRPPGGGYAGGGGSGGGKPKPATSKPAPTVTVIKKDKTTTHGQLIAVEPSQIKVQTKEGDILIAWADIRSVSNGLTRAKAIEQFRKEHPDQICSTCLGDGDIRCATCKGTGHDPASAKDCPTCKGELLVDCKTPKCDHGQVKCPNTCLKRSEGFWHEKDGKMVRDFPGSNGASSWFSEAHIGELIVREGNVFVSKGKCPTCDGKTTVPDTACDGTGKRPCPECIKRDAPSCKDCDHGSVKCTACDGTGIKKT